jgi:hypothetical protein
MNHRRPARRSEPPAGEARLAFNAGQFARQRRSEDTSGDYKCQSPEGSPKVDAGPNASYVSMDPRGRWWSDKCCARQREVETAVGGPSFILIGATCFRILAAGEDQECLSIWRSEGLIVAAADSGGVATLKQWETAFFESAFTHQNAQHRLTTHAAGFVGLWRELAGKKSFPSRYLASAKETLGAYLSC